MPEASTAKRLAFEAARRGCRQSLAKHIGRSDAHTTTAASNCSLMERPIRIPLDGDTSNKKIDRDRLLSLQGLAFRAALRFNPLGPPKPLSHRAFAGPQAKSTAGLRITAF